MNNFEYFMWLLQEDEELVEEINSMDAHFIPELANSVCECVDEYYEYEESYNN